MQNVSPNRPVIRDFAASDYQSVADINNAVDPDWPETAASLKEQDERRDPSCGNRRWIAQYGGATAGTGYYGQTLEQNDRERFHLVVQVHPNYQHRGIGGTLCDYVIYELRRLGATVLRTYAREDCIAAAAMLEHRGFAEYERTMEAHLDVEAFDFSPYSELVGSFVEQGIAIRTIRELETDPERDTKLHELDWEVSQDAPGAEDLTQLDLRAFLESSVNTPNALTDGFFVAVLENEYIGLCFVESDPGNNSLFHGITGVKRCHRRRGLAMVLKTKVIQFAKDNGYAKIRTCNEANNKAILHINERLGFVSKPAWVKYEKRLQ